MYDLPRGMSGLCVAFQVLCMVVSDLPTCMSGLCVTFQVLCLVVSDFSGFMSGYVLLSRFYVWSCLTFKEVCMVCV